LNIYDGADGLWEMMKERSRWTKERPIQKRKMFYVGSRCLIQQLSLGGVS
jgi:hypothetical protein